MLDVVPSNSDIMANSIIRTTYQTFRKLKNKRNSVTVKEKIYIYCQAIVNTLLNLIRIIFLVYESIEEC